MDAIRYALTDRLDGDTVQSTSALRLYASWQEHSSGQTLPSLQIFSSDDFSWCSDSLAVAISESTGAYRFTTWGPALTKAFGRDLKSTTTADLPGGAGRFLEASFDLSTLQEKPIYAVEHNATGPVHLWGRLVLPVSLPDTNIVAALVHIEAIEEKIEVLRTLSRTAQVTIASLEPVRDNADRIVDFTLMPLTQSQDGLADRSNSLGDLLGERPSQKLVTDLLEGKASPVQISSGRPDLEEQSYGLRFAGQGPRPILLLEPFLPQTETEGENRSHSALHALAASKTGYWRLNAQSQSLEVSQALIDLWRLEKPASEVTRSDLHALHPPKIRKKLDQALELALSSGKSYRLTAPLRCPDGTVLYVRIDTECEKAADGSSLSVLCVLRDVTEEHHRIRSLESAKADPRGHIQRMSDFASVASDWLWETDAEHKFTYVSPNANQHLPIPVEELIGRSRFEIETLKEDQEILKEHRADLEERSHFRNLIYRTPQPNGGVRHIRVSGKPVFDDENNFVGYRGVGQDVTTERERQIAIERSTEQLNAALELAKFGSLTFFPTSDRIELSPRATDILALGGDQTLDRDGFVSLFAEADQLKVARALERLKGSSKAASDGSIRANRPTSAGLRHIKIHSNNILTESQSSGVGFLLIQDMTVDVEEQQTLELAAREHERAQDVARIGSWSQNRASGEVYCSPAFSQLMGWTGESPPQIEEIIDQFHPEDREEVNAVHHRSLNVSGRIRHEARLQLPDGKIRDVWMEINTEGTDDPETLSIHLVLQDITAQKSQERALNRIVEAVNSAKEAILICEPEGKVTFLNQTAEGWFGYDAGALNRRGGASAIFNDKEDFEAIFSRIESDGSFEVELETVTEGDQHTTMLVKGASVASDDSIHAIVMTIDDVTERRAAIDQLRASERDLREAQRAGGFGTWRIDLGTTQYKWSPEVFELTGHDQSSFEPSRQNVFALMPETDAKAIIEAEKAVEESGLGQALDIQIQRADESFSDFTITLDLERTFEGAPVAIYGTLQDITARKQSERLLHQREQQLREAQKLGKMGSWAYTFGDEAYEWSPELYELLGYDPESFSPTLAAVLKLYAKFDAERIEDADAISLETGETYSLDVTIKRADGTDAAIVLTNKCEIDAGGNVIGFFGTMQDVTDRREAESKLERLAYYDTLTNIGNRSLFKSDVARVTSRCLRTGEKAAVMVLGIDRFKDVNDAMGHKAGDILIKATADRIRDRVKKGSSISRLGGDEFAIIIPNIETPESADAEAARIMQFFEEPFAVKEAEVFVKVSIGIVMLPSTSVSGDEILRQADMALGRAKDEGRGRASFYDVTFDEALRDRLAMSQDLRVTIDAGGEGLKAYFQPQVCLKTGRVIGFETLLRWVHPVRGFVRPDEFIAIAESNGLIGELGVWILRESCKHTQRWAEEGVGTFDIAVNVSPAQFWQVDMTAEVKRALEDTQLDPKSLTLELTESIFVDSGENTVKNLLDRFADMGIKLALDDFGTGYSSLGYLHALPFHKLKIDRCFIDEVEKEADKQSLLQGILGLGRGLGMTVVAEGAETPEQAALLRQWKCDIIQGYVFGRPMPAEDVPKEIARINAEAPVILGLEVKTEAIKEAS